jgi:hypothetical protein
MNDRRPDAILRDWRQAERERQADDENPELLARVDELRSEHTRAVDARQDVARDLGRRPQDGLEGADHGMDGADRGHELELGTADAGATA